jgi:hypothetical protein
MYRCDIEVEWSVLCGDDAAILKRDGPDDTSLIAWHGCFLLMGVAGHQTGRSVIDLIRQLNDMTGLRRRIGSNSTPDTNATSRRPCTASDAFLEPRQVCLCIDSYSPNQLGCAANQTNG